MTALVGRRFRGPTEGTPSNPGKESHLMYSSSDHATLRKTVGRLRGAAASLGVACLALPLSAAAAPTHYHHHSATIAVTRETVEARIAHLHASLMITLDEEQDWGAVAKVMRANEATMQALVDQERARPVHTLTAVQDLQTYESFSQAHVSGLEDLIASFKVLYDTMPAPQQALADHVFQKFGHKA